MIWPQQLLKQLPKRLLKQLIKHLPKQLPRQLGVAKIGFIWGALFFMAHSSRAEKVNTKTIGAPILTLIQDLKFSFSCHYGKDPDDIKNPEPVLLYESVFKNTGNQTLILNVYGDPLYVESISPPDAVRVEKRRLQVIRRLPPTASSLARIKPGEQYTLKGWSWPYARLPFYGLSVGEFQSSFVVKQNSKIGLRLCAVFGPETDDLKPFLKAQETVSHGQICADRFDFDYKILKTEI